MKKATSVFYDLGFSEEDVAFLEVKSALYSELVSLLKKKKLKQKDIQLLLDIPQSRVSELLNGKISSLSIEKLLIYLNRAGVKTSVKFSAKKVS